jgi:hypothetical protein
MVRREPGEISPQEYGNWVQATKFRISPVALGLERERAFSIRHSVFRMPNAL